MKLFINNMQMNKNPIEMQEIKEKNIKNVNILNIT